MLNTDFFRLMSFNLRLDMEERFSNGSSFRIHFLLSNESLSGKGQLIIMFDIDDQENGFFAVFGEDFVNMCIVGLEG